MRKNMFFGKMQICMKMWLFDVYYADYKKIWKSLSKEDRIFQNKSEYNGNGQILDKSKTLKNSYETCFKIYIKNWIKLRFLLSSSSKRKDELQ